MRVSRRDSRAAAPASEQSQGIHKIEPAFGLFHPVAVGTTTRQQWLDVFFKNEWFCGRFSVAASELVLASQVTTDLLLLSRGQGMIENQDFKQIAVEEILWLLFSVVVAQGQFAAAIKT